MGRGRSRRGWAAMGRRESTLRVAGVHDSDEAVPVADEEVAVIVGANDVGAVAELDRSGWNESLALEEFHRAIDGAGDGEDVGRGGVANALRFAQAFEPVDRFARRNVDGVDGVVARFGDEEASTLNIDSEMAKAAGDAGQRYGRFRK